VLCGFSAMPAGLACLAGSKKSRPFVVRDALRVLWEAWHGKFDKGLGHLQGTSKVVDRGGAATQGKLGTAKRQQDGHRGLVFEWWQDIGAEISAHAKNEVEMNRSHRPELQSCLEEGLRLRRLKDGRVLLKNPPWDRKNRVVDLWLQTRLGVEDNTIMPNAMLRSRRCGGKYPFRFAHGCPGCRLSNETHLTGNGKPSAEKRPVLDTYRKLNSSST